MNKSNFSSNSLTSKNKLIDNLKKISEEGIKDHQNDLTTKTIIPNRKKIIIKEIQSQSFLKSIEFPKGSTDEKFRRTNLSSRILENYSTQNEDRKINEESPQNFRTTKNFHKKALKFYEKLKDNVSMFKYRETGYNPLKKLASDFVNSKMSLEKDGRIENQRDISYINDLRTKTKRSINEAFSNKQIKKSTLINENDLSLINKVRSPIFKDTCYLQMKMRPDLQFESNVQKIKVNYLENQYNEPNILIDPLLLSNKYNPGILEYEFKEESLIKSIIRTDFNTKSQPQENYPKDFRLPVNRNDIISLSAWLDFMIETNIDSNATAEHQKEELQLIYSACLTEIIRQVSVECNERGALLTKVWSSLMNIWETALKEKNDYLDSMQQNYLTEVKRIHHMYETEIGILQQKNNTLEADKATIKDINDDLTEKIRLIKGKNRKLEKDMRGVLDKFEDLKKDFKQRINFQKKMEELLKVNNIGYDKNQLFADVIKEEGKNLAGISFNRSHNDELIKYQELDIDNKYDLDHWVFGTKYTDTEGLIITTDNFTEITKDFNFMLEMETSTIDLVTYIDKQTQAKIKKEKKIIELDEQILIEQTRKYHEKIPENISLLQFIEEDYTKNTSPIKKSTNNNNDPESLEFISMNEVENNEQKISDNLSLAENNNKESLKLPLSTQDFSQSPNNKIIKNSPKFKNKKNNKSNILVAPSKRYSLSSSKIIPQKNFKQIQEKIHKNSDLDNKISQQELISEKSEKSELNSNELDNSIQQQNDYKSPKTNNSFSPVKNSSKAEKKKIEKKSISIVGNAGIKGNKDFEPFIDFLNQKLFQKKVNNENFLSLQILLKFFNSNKIPTIFKENMRKVYPVLISQYNNLENELRSFKKKSEQLEIEKGVNKIEIFELKNQNQSLIDENSQKSSNINILKTNMDSMDENMNLLRSQYDKVAKDFQELLFQEDGHDDKNPKKDNQLNLKENFKLTPEELAKIQNLQDNIKVFQKKSSKIITKSRRIIQSFEPSDHTIMKRTIKDRRTTDISEIKHERNSSNNLDVINYKEINILNSSHKKKTSTYGIMPDFWQKRYNTFNHNYEFATQILQKVQTLHKNTNTVKKISKMAVLKYISSIYSENLKNLNQNKNPLYIIAYEIFLQKYGLKSVSESKYNQLLESSLCMINIPKVYTFCRLMNLIDSYQIDECNFYFMSLKNLDEIYNNGLGLSNIINEKIFISFSRGLDYCLNHFEKSMDKTEIKELFCEIENIAQIDKRNVKTLDLDSYMNIILTTYKKLKVTTRKNLEELFKSADLDQNEQIEYDEFLSLYRNVEKEKAEINKAKDIFFLEFDIQFDETGEKAMSFDRFVAVAVKYQIFSKQKQIIFKDGISQHSLAKNFSDLIENWRNIKRKLKLRVAENEFYSKHFLRIINTLSKDLKKMKKPANVLWMAFRLLDEETKRIVLDYHVSDSLPLELNIIQKIIEELQI